MVFSSLLFVFLFLALNLVCYYSVKTIRQKNIVLLVFSLIFYAWGGAAYLLLLAGMAFWSWLCALMIEKKQNKKYSTGNIKERGRETKGKRTFCTRKISREKLWTIYISRRNLRCIKN